MRSSNTPTSTDRRTTHRRAAASGVNAERRADGVRAVVGDRRVVDQRGIARSMIDALADILRWERTHAERPS